MKEVAGKTAVITGAAGGIGTAIAEVLAEEGAGAIVLADLAEAPIKELAQSIEADYQCCCRAMKTDVGSPEDINDLFSYASQVMETVDILVNCAGICPVDPIEAITSDQWDRTLNINLRSAFLCSQKAMEIMKRSRGGAIINVSSISGRIGGIATGVDYCTSKGGMITMTKTFAKSLGKYNVRVNSVAPGFIDTDMTKSFTHFDPSSVPLGRIGEPRDVADVVLFLASNRSRYITGCTIDITGGVYMN